MMHIFISVFCSNTVGRWMNVVSEKLRFHFYTLKRKTRQRKPSWISKCIFKCKIKTWFCTCSFLKSIFTWSSLFDIGHAIGSPAAHMVHPQLIVCVLNHISLVSVGTQKDQCRVINSPLLQMSHKVFHLDILLWYDHPGFVEGKNILLAFSFIS
jgi:hypothetical protein